LGGVRGPGDKQILHSVQNDNLTECGGWSGVVTASESPGLKPVCCHGVFVGLKPHANPVRRG
jgi:hypothetical protein